MRARRALPADGRRGALRRPDGGAPRPLEPGRPRCDRPTGRRPRSGAVRVPPRLPGQRPQPRLRLRALGEADHGRDRADGVRARGHGPRLPRQARAAVLVLLRLQRLQQQARGRLGDGPGRLRRRHCRGGARRGARRGRLQPARGRRALRLGRRRQARARRRHPSGRPPRGRVARELLRRGALPGPLGRAGGRLRRHHRADVRDPAGGADDPERAGRGTRVVPLDHLRGPLGRAPEGVLQRPDGAQPQGSVDGADPLDRGLARPRLRDPGGRRARDRRDRSVLRRRGDRVRRPAPGGGQPAPGRARPAARRGADHVGDRPCHLASDGAPPRRAPPQRRADAGRGRPLVRLAPAALHRDRRGLAPDRRDRLGAAGVRRRHCRLRGGGGGRSRSAG